MTTERCTSGPKWISGSELDADECLHAAERGSGQEFASPLLMSVGGETTLSAGRDEDGGWCVHTITMTLQNHPDEKVKPSRWFGKVIGMVL